MCSSDLQKIRPFIQKMIAKGGQTAERQGLGSVCTCPGQHLHEHRPRQGEPVLIACMEEAKHREETGQAEQDWRFALEQAAQKIQVLLKQLPSPPDLTGQQGHRTDKAGIIHSTIGRASFDVAAL